MSHRRIVSRHLVRENARRSERHTQRLLDRWRYDTVGNEMSVSARQAGEALEQARVPQWATSVRVERAGRIRARWVVVAIG